MRIRKNTEEGFDKEDVYTCIQQLCDLYETHIEELEKHYEVELTELTERCTKYDEKSLQYADIMMSAQKYHDDMVKQTNDEVYELMSNAQKQYKEKQLKIEDLRVAFESEKKVLGEELDAARNMADAKRDAMRAEVEAEKEKLDAIKLRYRQQIDAMEEEFQEIRTNILRTATSLNGLKSQVSISEEGQWTVTEGSEVVEFPTPDTGIEEILDVPAEQEEAIPADVIQVETEIEVPVEEPVAEVPVEELVAEAPDEEEPVAETVSEQPTERLFATDEIFAEKFFKSEIMDNIGTLADELSADIDLELIDKDTSELAPQETTKADADIEELLEEVSFEDIFADLPDADKAEVVEPVEEISLEGIEEINPQEFEEIITDSVAEVAEPEAAVVEEISLDDLEEIEKEVEQEATAQLAAEVAAVVAEETDAKEIDATADEVEESTKSAIPADEISFEGLEALFKDE